MTHSVSRIAKRGVVGLGVAMASLAVMALPASAHLHPTVSEGPAGGELTTAFTVGHGCDGSPTTKVEIKIPEGVTSVEPLEVPGFEVSTTKRQGSDEVDTVTWDNGELAADASGDFGMSMRLPDGNPGDRISFPVVQTCGSKTQNWLTPEVEGQPEPENPAPYITLTAGAATTTTATENSTATTVATTVPESTTTVAQASTPDEESQDDSGSQTGLIVGIVALVVVALGVGAFVATRNKSESSDESGKTDAGGDA